MFNYLARSLINNRLRLKRAQSYRVLGSGTRFRSDYIIERLNGCRRGPQRILTELPSDLRTPSELAAKLIESEITEHMLRCWTRRKKNPPPFFRINSHHILFRESAFFDWLNALTVPKTYRRGRWVYEHKRETGIANDCP